MSLPAPLSRVGQGIIMWPFNQKNYPNVWSHGHAIYFYVIMHQAGLKMSSSYCQCPTHNTLTTQLCHHLEGLWGFSELYKCKSVNLLIYPDKYHITKTKDIGAHTTIKCFYFMMVKTLNCLKYVTYFLLVKDSMAFSAVSQVNFPNVFL